MSKIIFQGIFGSHLYGTNVETSDTDIRQVHKDSLDNIILRKGMDNSSEHSNPNQKNSSEDIDFDSTELRKFISSCLSGQTFAMDMLHSPRNLWKEYSDEWLFLQENRHLLVTNNVKPFIAYCKNQRDKYSKKGDKLNELIKLRQILSERNPKCLLSEVYKETDELTFEHIKIKQIFNSGSKNTEFHLSVVDSSYPLSRQIAEILKSLDGKIEAFGKRALKAAENNGTDLKATYHAFRVAWELEELLNYGYLTFPSKRKELLLKIRNGDYNKNFLDYWLVEEIDRVNKIENHLPKPDYKFWDNWILTIYKKEI